jgi:hypothetical protein
LSWSLQSSPVWIVTPGAEHWAAVWPSPSSSFAAKTHAPRSVSHVAVAQPGGVVVGSLATHWVSDVHPVVVTSAPPSWEPLAEGVLLQAEASASGTAAKRARARNRELAGMGDSE